MPRFLPVYLRRLLRGDGRRRRFVARYDRNGAGPSNQHAQPPQPDVPAWLLAGPAAPMLDAAEDMDPALAAPPPPFRCSVHGCVVFPLHGYDFATHDAPQPPPTPAIVEAEAGAPLARSPTAPPVPDAPLAPRLPSPTPATPPCSPRGGARRHIMALGVPRASSPSSLHSRIWSAAALGLASCAANGVASSHGFLGDSSSEEDDGALGPSTRRR